jgi:Excreted virulence factor EspC, type VII ESX diderm
VSGGQFQVNSSDLVSHAAEVDGIGDGLDTAKQAGAAVRVDTGAFGQLCQFVPALLNDLQTRLIDGIGSAVTAAHDTADALRSTAADYDAADGNTANRMRKIR